MLTNKVIQRVELGHEPGQWIEVRQPSFLIMDECDSAERGWLALLQRCITAWSYEDAVSPESVAELDTQTVAAVLNALHPKQDEAEEKKDGEPSTIASTGTARSKTNG